MAASQGLLILLIDAIDFFDLLGNLDGSNLFCMDLSQPEPFRKQIAEARRNIQTLWVVRNGVDRKIEDLRSLIRANANFLPDVERHLELMALELLKVPTNIAEAVKHVLFLAKIRNERLTPVQIKETAESRGFDFGSYTNPMASIHTIVKRMKDSDPAELDFEEKTGTYQYIKLPGAEVGNPEFFKEIRTRVSEQLWAQDRDKAQALVSVEVDKFLKTLTNRPDQMSLYGGK
jgi:hypothetical protein